MKPIIVNVQLQLDIPETDDDLNQVISALDNINMQLFRESEENYNIQIFTNSISRSDLMDVENEDEEEEETEEE